MALCKVFLGYAECSQNTLSVCFQWAWATGIQIVTLTLADRVPIPGYGEAFLDHLVSNQSQAGPRFLREQQRQLRPTQTIMS